MRPNGSSDTRTPPRPALLVVQTSFLGDVVLTAPLVTALRRHLHPRRVAVLVRPESAPLLIGHPDVDAILIDDKRGADRGLRGLLRTARRLRAERFDLAVSPHRSWRTALVLAAAGIPHRVGFDERGRGAFLFHHRVARDRRRHDVERNLALAAALGAPTDGITMHLTVQAAAATRAAALLPAGAGPLIGLAPGSAWVTKRWTVAGFASVVSAMARDGARCVLLGGPDEVALAEDIRVRSGGSATVLAGRTDLPTLVAVIDRLAVLVANDSAPMHIACARGVPVAAVFCATSPAFGYGPYGAPARVIEADLACRPCARHGGRSCPRGTEDCMRLVTPAAVLKAVRALLAEGPAGRRDH